LQQQPDKDEADRAACVDLGTQWRVAPKLVERIVRFGCRTGFCVQSGNLLS